MGVRPDERRYRPRGRALHGTLTFVEQAYTGEMCNLFGMYAPSTDPTGDGTWSSILNP
jgi:hypothetical protein